MQDWKQEGLRLIEESGLSTANSRATALWLAERLAMGSSVQNAFRDAKAQNREDIWGVNTYYKERSNNRKFAAAVDEIILMAKQHFDSIASDRAERSMAMLRNSLPVAARALVELAVDKNVPPATRLAAIKELFDRALPDTAIPDNINNVNVLVDQRAAPEIDVRALPIDLRERLLAHVDEDFVDGEYEQR